jgi:hypothetical protein
MHLWYALVNKMTGRISMVVPATPYFLDGPFEDHRILCKLHSHYPRKFVGTEDEIKQLFNLK